jgi:hypothetical protein
VRILVAQLYRDGSNLRDLEDLRPLIGRGTVLEVNDTDICADVDKAFAQRDALRAMGDAGSLYVVVLEPGEPLSAQETADG